jgi:hypothetical protein
MKKFLLPLVILLTLTGCGPTKYIYVKPTYPKIQVPRRVQGIEVTIKNGCMWRQGHNTNLCGEDLEELLLLIKNLRTNENVLRKNIQSYHNFVKKKSGKVDAKRL